MKLRGVPKLFLSSDEAKNVQKAQFITVNTFNDLFIAKTSLNSLSIAHPGTHCLPLYEMNNQQSYRDATRMQDRQGLLQEFDASTAEDAKHWRTADIAGVQESRGRKGLRALAEYRWFITTGILVVVLGFQLVIWNRIRDTAAACSPQVGGDYVEKTQTCESPFTVRQSAPSC